MGKIFKFALALFLIGVGVIAVFSIISEESIFAAVDEEDYEYVELIYSADDFTGFDFNFDNRDFYVLVSEDDQVKVTYYKTEKEDVVIDDDGETLSITHETVWYEQWFIGLTFFTNDEYLDVFVYLPSSVIYDVDFSSTNGTMDMKNFDNIDDLRLATSNGKILVENVSSASMNLDTSNGEVRLTNVTVETDLDLGTSNGRVYLTDVTADVIDGHSSNGRIIATDIISNDISLDTSNGTIELTVIGERDDYEVRLDTSNGDLNYDGMGVTDGSFNQGAAKKIDLDSSNGDVSVEFID